MEEVLRRRAKQALRKRMKKLRLAWSQERRDQASVEIRAALLERLKQEPRGGVIALFSPLVPQGEVDVAPLMNDLEALGWNVALPRVLGDSGEMAFHVVSADMPLEPGAHGVHEPSETLPVASAEDFQAVVVPGLAFGPKGQRLGFGGGYYDRFLAKLEREVPRLGVGFSVQLLADLPTEPTDEAMSEVFSERAHWICSDECAAEPLAPHRTERHAGVATIVRRRRPNPNNQGGSP